jgi:hypothetical protein
MSDLDLCHVAERIRKCLRRLYTQDAILFERNRGRGVCERCLVFRFAMYLQEEFVEYFVDCDFNSSAAFIPQGDGGTRVVPDIPGKGIRNRDGTTTKRFVDIIIHRRTLQPGNDFICFEIKKTDGRDQREAEKDRNNLLELTSQYGYRFGFYLILGKTLDETRWEIYQRGQEPTDLQPVLGDLPATH